MLHAVNPNYDAIQFLENVAMGQVLDHFLGLGGRSMVDFQVFVLVSLFRGIPSSVRMCRGRLIRHLLL